MNIPFTKMQGLGNDFIVINGLQHHWQLPAPLIRQMADRHYGIGFDQLLLIEPPQNHEVDFTYRIFNADGTEVAQCGNGARCVAKYLKDNGLSTGPTIRLSLSTQQIEAHIQPNNQIKVNMAIPRFTPTEIPFNTTQQHNPHTLTLPTQKITLHVVNLGNPHAIIRVDNTQTAPVQNIGQALQNHPAFPEKVNVGFMQILDRQHIQLRVYERGVGETQACGSGACAAAVIGQQQGWLDKNVEVQLPGGQLHISWAGENQPVWMTGPAETVFVGEFIVNDQNQNQQ